MTACVDYFESVDSAMCDKHAVSNFEARFGRIKSLTVCRSTLMLSGKFFFARTFRTAVDRLIPSVRHLVKKVR